MGAGPLEVRAYRGRDARSHDGSRRAWGPGRDDALDGLVAERAVADGVAQRLGHARHADAVCEREDAAHVVAGGPAAGLAQTGDEGLGGAAEAQELRREHVAARGGGAELGLVLGPHVATAAPGLDPMDGDSLAADLDLELALEDPHPGLVAGVAGRHGVALSRERYAEVVADQTRLTHRGLEATRGQRDEPRALHVEEVHRAALGGAVQAYPGDLA